MHVCAIACYMTSCDSLLMNSYCSKREAVEFETKPILYFEMFDMNFLVHTIELICVNFCFLVVILKPGHRSISSFEQSLYLVA